MTDDVLISTHGKAGRLSLNRPQAIHALTHGMCTEMGKALLAWREDPAVEIVIIDHSEGRGFCSGGDIRVIWESGMNDGVEARAFFHDEYRVNHLLFTYPKPVIAFMDGITMGGGVGISQPAKYRIATERTTYAMPETGIGLFPDVGGGWYLSRLPGRAGQYLGGTGARIKGEDCVALGLSTHYIPSEALPALKDAIAADPTIIEKLLAEASVVPPSAKIVGQQADIDRLFASNKAEDVIDALENDKSDFAKATLDAMRTKSPQTIKVALRQLAIGAGLSDFADEMRMEYRIASHVCQRNDFLEGVRALIVDKTNDPKWDPPTIEAVSDALVDEIFAPLAPGDEWTPYPL